MNLSGINLNLLVALDAMISERNLTKAAEKLHTSQPALSHALKQLREIFDDELLFKGASNKMILTPKAKSLIQPLKLVLSQISNIFTESEYFDPVESSIKYNLGMSDYASIMLLPGIIDRIKKFSGNINLNIIHLNNFSTYDDFASNNIDFAIGYYSNSSHNILSEELFSTKLVCVARQGHPALKSYKININDFLSYPHLQAVFREDLNRLYTEIIESGTGKFRNKIITVPHIMTALFSLNKNNCICMAHENIVEKYKDILDLQYSELPFDTPNMSYSLYWKKEDENIASHKWLKEAIVKSIKS